MNSKRIASARRPVARLLGVAAALALAVGAVALMRGGSSAASVTSSIITTYGVGGVLKSDGALYQWRPEQKMWSNIDESFRLDGETRHVLPLPVPASDVAKMNGFGFIVTRSGDCWLYNLDTNHWENIGRP
jgi:ABC-type protease/lipase transport system fused ATPase/permease subunit